MSIFKSIITQSEAMDKFLPLIKKSGQKYVKFTKVRARPAKVGEMIETITSDGKETQNKAKEGDYVVTNLGGSGEEYILSGQKLRDRYDEIGDSIFQAKGSCMALQYNGEPTEFIASWGEPMVLKPGDLICTPLPSMDEVYRIALAEFLNTYRIENN